MFEREKPKIIVIRPLLFIFVSMILLVLCTFFMLTSQLLGFCVSLAFFCALVLYCAVNKKYILSILMVIISLFCSIYLIIDYSIFSNAKLDEDKKYIIVGRADELVNHSSYGYTRVLENCTIYLEDKIVATNKKVKLFLTGSDVECGDEITFEARITNFEYFTSIGLTNEACKGINYSVNLS